MKNVKLTIVFLLFLQFVKADEGMWLPYMLQQLNSTDLYIKGLKIPVEEIYSADKSSLKDAVVLFGGGCTGEVISKEGLILTNHHCGYSSIQANTTLENNYLRNGFWAREKREELKCPNLTVTFIIKMEDITAKIATYLNDSMTEQERQVVVEKIAGPLERKAVEGTHYKAQTKAFYDGNLYVLITSEVFKDIRLVGAPPVSIGDFGSEEDNWVWPRHTGDFAVFRIYADKENAPADYDTSNVPFHPRRFLPVSMNGVKEGDFTMVYGFPGRTQQYLPSYGLDLNVNISNPTKVGIRDKKIAVLDKYMHADEKVFIQYAAKLRTLANAYKKWQGETAGIKRTKGIEAKQRQEAQFQKWTSENPERQQKYGALLTDYATIYNNYKKYITAADYYSEAALGCELISYCIGFQKLVTLSKESNPDLNKISEEVFRLTKVSENYFRNYYAPLDRELITVLMDDYRKKVDQPLQPEIFQMIKSKYKDDLAEYVEMLFKKSVFVDAEKVKLLLKDYDLSKLKQIESDPAYLFADGISGIYNRNVSPTVNSIRQDLMRLNRLYISGLQEKDPTGKFYPDANSTLRLAYGNVKSYHPKNGVEYKYYTTIDGIMEKMLEEKEDYTVPARLKQLVDAKDYGRYAVNGTVPVAFIATNHTTGGNSGSPVLNDKGQLIGINFDRDWEGIMSDYQFSADQSRNISVDIRYVLFIIDKYAEASYLLNEMELVY